MVKILYLEALKLTKMKKTPFLLTLLFVLAFIAPSCSKSSGKPSTTTVEYQITPMNVYFTKITFNDQTGSSVVITDPSQFSGGAKSIVVTTKPFSAKLQTEINNTTSTPVTYNLVILVDGQMKKTQPCSAPPNATATNSVEFSVQ